MSPKDFDVLFHVPYNTENITDDDIRWIDNFQSILKVSVGQILKQNIKITNPIGKENSSSKELTEFDIVFQFIFNNDYVEDKCVQKSAKEKDQLLIQLISKPNIQLADISKSDHVKSYDLFGNNIKGYHNLDIKNLKSDIWLKILDITYEIKQHLLTINKTSDQIIYIAETSNDQEGNRENLIREFTHLGYKVLPDEDLPNDMLDFSEKVSEQMQNAILSVHIIGNQYAPLIENIEVSKVEIQNDIFSEIAASNSLIKRYVWIPPNIKPKSEKQKQYIESFKRNIELLVNTEIIQTPLEVFKSILKKNINVKDIDKKEKLEEEVKTKSAYIMHTYDDLNKVNTIRKELKALDIDILNTNKENSKIDLIQEHKRNLVECDILIIFYSSENEQWLNSKLSDVIKSPGFGKNKDYNLKLLLLDTDIKPKSMLTLKDMEMLDIKDKDISGLISSLIEKYK